MTDAQREGRAVDYRDLAAEHPDLADDLRELWGAVLLAEAVGIQTSSLASAAALNARPIPSSPSLLSSGIRTFGDYELLEELGRGGMGIVYKARQISLDRIVALKMILRGDFATPADRARFKAEAEAAARLDHPHIVPVYEVGEYEGQPFFSMKYVPGTTLSKRLSAGPMTPREAAALLSKVAKAVQFAHARGVLHRDLKPSNILLDASDRPHVVDFGLAKRIGDVVNAKSSSQSLTQTGAILGTPAYLAPEQAAGSRGVIGPTVDVYALGTILYQMLTGRPPFQAASPLDTLMLVLEQDPPLPHSLNPKADRELEMIALKALQKPPELRYPSAELFAADLDAYLAGEPISARSGGFSEILSRLFRETHHAAVLESWGLLWMWHAVVLLVLCLATNVLQLQGVATPWPYVLMWTGGLFVWGPIFWWLRHRAGPVTFVERQIAHAWGGSIVASSMLFVVEMLLGLPPLKLSPVIAIISGMVFVVKAGILSGSFYAQAAALFLTAAIMPLVPSIGHSLLGLVSAACFFVPGLKYYRQRVKSQKEAAK